MKTITKLMLAISMLVSTPLLMADNSKKEEVKITPFTAFSEKLSSGLLGIDGYISSKKDLDKYLESAKGLAEEEKQFLLKTDFTKEKVFAHAFTHAGSGQDQPAYECSYSDGVLICNLFDANKSLVRSSDLRRSELHLFLRVDKAVVKEIVVKNLMAPDVKLRKQPRATPYKKGS